jgi:hypothetical protein
MLTLALALVANGRAKPAAAIAHTCSAPDRQFIQEARTNMTALGLWADQYQSGDAEASEVVSEARRAAKTVQGMGPTDPSLEQTRRLMVGMLVEYAKAVQIQEGHGNAGPHMYRAYGLANYAHGVLENAQPALSARGCDLSQLL